MNNRNNIHELKKEIIEIGKKSVLYGYVTTIGGNISVRLRDNRFLITATGIPLDELNEENIIVIDQEGTSQEKMKPSKETTMHLLIYHERPDINSVVHLHPIISTTLASIDVPITPVTFEELYFIGDTIGIVSQMAAGGGELHRTVLSEAKKSNVVILKNHGCVAVGSTLKEAYFRVVKLERAAQATMIAKIFGKTIAPFSLLG